MAARADTNPVIVRPVTEGSAARAVRVPAPALLAGMVLVAATVHGLLALRSPSPWIMPDELIYTELAKSLGDGELPSIRGEVSFHYGLGYPLLLAPIWALFEHVPTAYAVTKVWNALLMSLAAVPGYFLARRFVGDGSALVVAGLTVAVPSLLYAGTIFTEVALYPAFLLALLAMAVALDRPTAKTQIATLGAIALACSIKVLAAVLVPSYVAAIGLFHWLDTRDRASWNRRLRSYAPTWIALGALGVLGAAITTALGTTPAVALGAYAPVLGEIDPRSVPWWTLVHLAELDLYVAIIPFAATLVVTVSACTRSHCSRYLYPSLVLPVATGLVLAVAAYSSKPHAGGVGYLPTEARVHERNTFVLAPLLFLGLVICLNARPWHTHRRAVLFAGLTSTALPAAIPLEQVYDNVRFQALALVLWVAVHHLVHWLVIAIPLCAVLALLFVRACLRPSAPYIPPATVLAALLFVAWAAQAPIRWGSEWTSRQAWGERPDWVDTAVGSTEAVFALWYEPPGKPFVASEGRHHILWVGEFFNRSIGTVYEIGSPMAYALPTLSAHVRADGVVTHAGTPLDAGRLVFVPCHVRPVGDVIAVDRQTGASVYRVSRPLRVNLAHPQSCGVARR